MDTPHLSEGRDWLSRMPNELLLMVGNNLRIVADIGSLARVNRHFHQVFNHTLYNTQLRTRLDKRALPCAVRKGCEAGVVKALNAGARELVNSSFPEMRWNPRFSTGLDENLLYHAVFHGYRGIVKLLLDAGAVHPHVSRRQRRRTPPDTYHHQYPNLRIDQEHILETAVQMGHYAIAQDLLSHGGFTTTRSLIASLRAAASNGHSGIFFELLSHLEDETSPEVQDWLVNRAIIDICRPEYEIDKENKKLAEVMSMADYVLRRIKEEHWEMNIHNSLHQVCRGHMDSAELLELFISHGLDPMLRDDDYRDRLPIAAAMQTRNTTIVKHLIDQGHFSNHPFDLEYLLEEVCFGDPTKEDEYIAIAEWLFAQGAALHEPSRIVKDAAGRLCRYGNGRLFQLLLDNDPEFNRVVLDKSPNLLRYACKDETDSHLALTKVVFNKEAKPNSGSRLHPKLPQLHFACTRGKRNSIKVMVEYTGKPTGKASDVFPFNTLDISLAIRDSKTVQMLLEYAKAEKSRRGQDAGDEPAGGLQALLSLDSNDVIINPHYYFTEAAGQGDVKTMSDFFDKRIFPPLENAWIYRYFDHPLMNAVANNHPAAVQKCLDMGYDPLSVSNFYKTQGEDGLIVAACYRDSVKVLDVILRMPQREHDIVEGLKLAIDKNNVEMVKRIYMHLVKSNPGEVILRKIFNYARGRKNARMMDALDDMGAPYDGEFWWSERHDNPKYVCDFPKRR
ncbi:ankyrin repeats (3 copies) domain-containing protein [Pochonia chlamydosporia 170]|uniref:Ankyrin repeats (3 copies) domain-containing protein n=1 Tax=Pochonia chlamydosporia 170 TaxID=1380566 RepID=A0A179FRI8_METCM|nr:ankyrin repeats (3 copies) domain-containing protein [Pochonia chlamydosporia 170]OAQ67751.1 ankyrin repeats (3 copies) domain-containing protein [Pochonia chlamydosporia 170]